MKKGILTALGLCLLFLCACGRLQSPLAGESGQEQDRDSGVAVTLTGSGAEVKGGGASVSGSVVTIGAVGEYRISGMLDDGQIVVDTGEDKVDVTLVLDGAQISNSAGPAILVRQAKNVHVVLARDSENVLTSGTEADLAAADENRSGAAIFSEDDLSFEGGGSLTVRGYLNNGITCKDDLKIKGGAITVLSANNGVRASESLTVTGGMLSVTAGNDGLKTSSAAKEGKGFIELTDGSVSIRSGGDGVDAVGELRVTGGSLQTESRQDLVSNGSRKGLKAGTLLSVTGGSVSVRADEDGLRCDGNIRLSGGSVSIIASTGVQSGVKDSGAGDIEITGGSLFVSAAGQALKAEGRLSLGGELLALSNSDKQRRPDAGGPAYVMADIEGAKDERLLLGMDTIIVPQSFRVLLYASSSLRTGETFAVQVEDRGYSLTVR